MPDYLAGLNASQKRAVMHTTGPLLVLAGAGSGKTRVLTARIARLVKEKECAPSEILAVTFTNKAAREMRERISRMVSAKAAEAMTVSTFHAFGARMLREDGHLIGLAKHFSILNDYERVSTIKTVMRSHGRGMKDEDHERLAAAISLAKNASLDPNDYHDAAGADPKAARIYQSYNQALLKRQSVDFDDLLLLPLRILESHPDVLTKYRERYVYVSIDEFQDTNAVQMKLARLLSAPRNNIMVVGDDDQGIYSWRGADIENILSFAAHFKSCATVVLDVNYRSTRQILDGASAVVGRNRKRKPKQITAAAGDGDPIRHFRGDDEGDEAEWVATTIQSHHACREFAFGDHAVLLRTNAQMRRFEEALRRARVPYRTVGAMSFFDRKEIRDVVACMRFLANPDDELSFTRLLKVPDKGIVKPTIEALDDCAARRKISLWRAALQADAIDAIPPAQRAKLADFTAFCRRHHEEAAAAPAKAVRAMLDESGYFTLLDKAYREPDGANPRRQNIEELLADLADFERRKRGRLPLLAQFLQELSLAADDDKDDDKDGSSRVRLMTLHKSKGLEFPVVFLAGLDDSIIPSPRAVEEGKIDEERRLFYVGMTRARKRLILTYPATKLFRAKTLKVKPCRFINEIPGEFLDGELGRKEDENYQEFVSGFFKKMEEKLGSGVAEAG